MSIIEPTEIEAVLNTGDQVTLSTGRKVTIKPATFGKLGPILKFVGLLHEAFPHGEKLTDAALFLFLATKYEEIGGVVATLADMTADEISNLYLTDFVKVVKGVISVNAAFFEKELLPLLKTIAREIANRKAEPPLNGRG